MNANLFFLFIICFLVTCCNSESSKAGDRAKSMWRDYELVLRQIDSSIRSGVDIEKMAIESKKIGVEDVFRLGEEIVFVVRSSGLSVSGTSETIRSRSSNPHHLVRSIETEVRSGSKMVRMSEKLADGWFVFYTR